MYRQYLDKIGVGTRSRDLVMGAALLLRITEVGIK